MTSHNLYGHTRHDNKTKWDFSIIICIVKVSNNKTHVCVVLILPRQPLPPPSHRAGGEQVPQQPQGLHQHVGVGVREQPEQLLRPQGAHNLHLHLLIRLERHVLQRTHTRAHIHTHTPIIRQ